MTREVFLEKPSKINFFWKKNLFLLVFRPQKKNVIRGLHLQRKFAQGKYLSVLKGEIFDVVVDLRKNSKNFGKYFSIRLSDKNGLSIFIPEGFAHGFVGMKKENLITY